MLHDFDESGQSIGSDLIFSSLGPVVEAVDRAIGLKMCQFLGKDRPDVSPDHAYNRSTHLHSVCQKHHLQELGHGVDPREDLHHSAKMNRELHSIQVIHWQDLGRRRRR